MSLNVNLIDIRNIYKFTRKFEVIRNGAVQVTLRVISGGNGSSYIWNLEDGSQQAFEIAISKHDNNFKYLKFVFQNNSIEEKNMHIENICIYHGMPVFNSSDFDENIQFNLDEGEVSTFLSTNSIARVIQNADIFGKILLDENNAIYINKKNEYVGVCLENLSQEEIQILIDGCI